MSSKKRKSLQKAIKLKYRGNTLQQLIDTGVVKVEELEGNYVGGLTLTTNKNWWKRKKYHLNQSSNRS